MGSLAPRPATPPRLRAVAAALWALAGLTVGTGAAAQSSASRHHRTHSSARHGQRPRVNLRAYRAAVRSWHDAQRMPAPEVTPDGRLVLRLWSVNTHARAEVVPAGPEGGFDDAAREAFSRVMMDPRTHSVHPADPRLLDLVYRVARHFDAPQVSVISGYRAGAGHSNHAFGRAIDVLIPGVSDRSVADYARSLEPCGVGMYPVSGFVHLDVRDRSSYWVDSSGPGSSSRRHHRRHHRERHHAARAAHAR